MTTLFRSTLPALALGAALVAYSPLGQAQPAEGNSPSQPKGPAPLARILNSEQAPEALLERMAGHLNLTEEQKAKILPILESARKDFKAAHEGGKAVMDSTREQIDAILTPEQREKLTQTRERVADRVQEVRERRGPMGPGILPLLRGLNLTDEQTSQIRSLASAQKDQREAIHQETRRKMDELDKALLTQVEALLTTEQKTEFQERLKNRPEPQEMDRQGPPRRQRFGGDSEDQDRPSPRPRGPQFDDRNSDDQERPGMRERRQRRDDQDDRPEFSRRGNRDNEEGPRRGGFRGGDDRESRGPGRPDGPSDRPAPAPDDIF